MKGDLIKLASQFDVIVHGCNCMCTMGSGIAKQIKSAYPEAYQADMMTACRDPEKLGTISWADCGDVIVVNAYTQFRYGRDKRHVNYDAVRSCFKIIAEQFSGKHIAYPKIGAGDWIIIKKIIDEELDGETHTLVEYV